MSDVLERLASGDKRTKGAADAVAEDIKDSAELFDEVFKGLYSDNPGLRMRAADALEKASASNPSLLANHAQELLGPIGSLEQQEVQWHVAQMLPRCELTPGSRTLAIDLMCRYFDQAKSAIVRVFALQAIYDFSQQDTSFEAIAGSYLDQALHDSTPSLRARARRLNMQHRH